MTTATRRLDGFPGGFDIAQRDTLHADQLATLRTAIEERIAALLAECGDAADPLCAAMRTGALSAGKRMRPLLVMLAARDLGCTSPALADVACAVEMVHAASLMLDDMPCMDNAQLRRGKPAIHVQYGEDVTILASVALLSRAFGVLATAQDIPPLTRTRLVGRLAETIGTQGLVRGQFQDLHGGARTLDAIATTNELKTGVLLGVAVDMAAIIAQASDGVAQSLRAFALAAGHAFQIRDDFQDLPGNDSAVTGKDTGLDLGKTTLLASVGADEAQRRLARHLHDAQRHLDAALGPRSATRQFLESLFAQDRGRPRLPTEATRSREALVN
ncbi:polyprenyl synthetase family protein [Massilia yuzhufengensis]|uniref:Geranylgeranyl diphosphate synthase, type II n=1 Tax=Massilia yuzhufengensis TaxID=1164594 RepID=A0A1I1K5X1_9BURK|nr:polyprenyl synthetase family protein [Massilia yuzhufengensis]SFC56126.1 geranylgeranyl diphosphate synthase, type II [Massilia yuzhufengensis]